MENKEQNNNESLNTEKQETKVNKKNATKRNIRKKTETKDSGEKKKTVARKQRTPRNNKKTAKTDTKDTSTHGEEPSDNIDNANVTPTEVSENTTKEDTTETAQLANTEELKHATTETKTEAEGAKSIEKQKQSIPPLPNITINNIVELLQAPTRSIVLTDQQIQQLTLEEIQQRHRFLEETLARVLDYDVVISDTNIWLELLIGYTSSHSDPRYNARLQFERQLEFISKLTLYRGGRFIILGETYEEIDRFATMLDPTDHRDADFTDNIVCLNTAARLAKRLILAQQRENRLRICGIGAESHHAAFADPAIIRKVAELFASGKKVLLMTNDASVAIRAMGICDDLQHHNNISDEDWDKLYTPLRPMVFTFDDLKQLDFYTRQYHYIQMAAGVPWMADIDRTVTRNHPTPLELSMDAFRPGDKHRCDNLFSEQEVQLTQQKAQQQQQQKKQQAKTQNSKTTVKPTDNKIAKLQKTEQQFQTPAEQPLHTPQNEEISAPAESQNTSINEQRNKPRTRRKTQRRKPTAENNGEQQQ